MGNLLKYDLWTHLPPPINLVHGSKNRLNLKMIIKTTEKKIKTEVRN